MKYLAVPLLFMAMLIIPDVVGQTHSFGPKAGLNMSTWYGSGISGTRWRVGYQAGLALDIDFGNKLHFAPELILIQKGASQLNNNAAKVKDKWQMYYIEVPLMAKFDLTDNKGNHPFFSLGATASYFLFGRYRKTQDGVEVVDSEVNNLQRKYDFGAAAGAGMDLGAFIFEFRGQVGFVSFINASAARNATLSLNLTYFLNHNKQASTTDDGY